MIALDDATQSITFKDAQQMNSISMQVGMTRMESHFVMTLEAPFILHGQSAVHPAVLGDELLAYLNQLVMLFNTHTHPGELAVGVLPVTPAIPLPLFPPASPSLLSVKNLVE